MQAQYKLTDWIEGLIVSSATIGCLIGSALAGTLSDRFGRKRILLLAAVLFTACAIGSAMPRVPWHLVGGAAGRRHGYRHRLDALADVHRRNFAARLRGGLIAVYQLAITLGVLARLPIELRLG